jgi:hypothetical protein
VTTLSYIGHILPKRDRREQIETFHRESNQQGAVSARLMAKIMMKITATDTNKE